jgi:hypothetical protein
MLLQRGLRKKARFKKRRRSAHLSSRTTLFAAGERVGALVLMAAVRRGGIGAVSLCWQVCKFFGDFIDG